jgi:HEAT repeat protein
MWKRRKVVIAVACMAAVAALSSLRLREPEPTYHGRPLSEWIEQYRLKGGREYSPPHFSPDFSPFEEAVAAEAIQHIGTNAIPWLLDWMSYKPATNRFPICNQLPKWMLGSRPMQYLLRDDATAGRAWDAELAFGALGPTASPAIPELSRLAALSKSPVRRDSAISALASLGKPAVPSLAALLSTPDPAVSRAVMLRLSDLETNPRAFVPLLVQNLGHTNSFVATTSARTLAELKLDPEMVVPALTRCLQDPRREVRM